MKVVTMRLRRYKIIHYILNIIVFPIRFPIFLLYSLEELRLFEKLLELMDKILRNILERISVRFKFEDEAFRQKKINPDKFKNLY